MANRLAKEKSLYLQQHADNPVDWWAWGEEAFAEAQRLHKPVLVSIGYSACHWCHVMAHESFENEYIAKLMNQHFVCIKVDREEHPEVDTVFMEAVQMINQHGGWPLNAFCFPDGRVFFGGTYFPPEDRGNNMIPWPQLLMRIHDYYTNKQEELLENAEAIEKNLWHNNTPQAYDGALLAPASLIQAAKNLCGAHDDQWGGFGGAPKFPPSMALDFLLSIRNTQACENDPALAERVEEVLEITLQRMACGGLFDQVGGGFFRYSVDAYWAIPHFEKMLYDNGQLLSLFVKASTHFPNRLYRAVADETAQWMLRFMRADNGLFAASWDADSEGHEGAYYVWSKDEVVALLGDEAENVCAKFGITEKGNFEEGKTNLSLRVKTYEEREQLLSARRTLLQARLQRTAPGRDDKSIVSWNALGIKGLALAAFYFERSDWWGEAVAMADRMYAAFAEETGHLPAIYYQQEAWGRAKLEDYALLAEAFLQMASFADSFALGTAQRFLDRAIALADAVMRLFYDQESGGFFTTPTDGDTLLHVRKKSWYDNAMPSGNSAMVRVLGQLNALVEKPAYRAAYQSLQKAYKGIAETLANATAHALTGFTDDAMGVAVIHYGADADVSALFAGLRKKPHRAFLVLPAEEDLGEHFQLCIGQQCLPLESQAAVLLEKL